MITYKGFEIDVKREMSLAGYSMLYYSVFRISDGWELTSGFSDSNDTIKDMESSMKSLVDDYEINPSDYEEMSSWYGIDPTESA